MPRRKSEIYDDFFWEQMELIYPQKGGSKILRDLFGLAEGTICLRAQERGIESDQTSRLRSYKEAQEDGSFDALVREHVPGFGGVSYLAEMFHVNTETIRRAAKRLGVCSEDAELKRYHQKYLKVDFFKNIGPVQAYYLGYLWADGSILRTARYVDPIGFCMHCKREDEYLIIKLRDLLASRHGVWRGFRYDENGEPIRTQTGRLIEMSSVTICSKEMACHLVNECGIVPRKTYVNPPFPGWVTDDLLPHFFRGCFDGDGWAGEYKPYMVKNVKRSIGFCGSEKFTEELFSRIRRNLELHPTSLMWYPDNPLIWRFSRSAVDDVRKIRDWMYTDCGDLYLERKKLILDRA